MIITNKKEEEIIGNRRWADRGREHENVSVAPVPESGYPGPQPGPEQAQGQGRYRFRGSEGSSSQCSNQSEMNNGDSVSWNSHNSLWDCTFGSTEDLPQATRRGEKQSGRRNVAGCRNDLPQGVA